MTFFWVIFLLGFYYLSIFGNFYSYINPFKILFNNETKLIEYPKQLGFLPAFLFFVVLIWIELFAEITPLKLSLILIIYTVINFLGTRIVGSKAWFEYCELFSVLFKIVSRDLRTKSFTIVIFILFMLSSTAFDGLHTTLPWYSFLVKVGDVQILQTLGLILSPFVFFIIYILLVWAMQLITKSSLKLTELATQFSFSLVPIAIVYNLAHYYTLLINQGQEIIRLISDPFGFGWNLFGTANFKGILFTNAGFIWHSQVALILTGHIIAVFLAHKVSLELFKTRSLGLLSQIPFIILMIIYTLIGLWILSQPLTVSAHFPGQPPFFKLNNSYVDLYPVPLTSLYDFNLPQDLALENYLVNQLITFEIDTSVFPITPEIITKSKFRWNFGDGQVGEGLKNTHIYSKPGSYILDIYLLDGISNPQLFEKTLINVLPNKDYRLPKAVIKVNNQTSNSLTLGFGKPLQFDATLSEAGSAKIVSYFWDFGDGRSSTDPQVSHGYEKIKTQVFPVLRVTDENGFISDIFISIQNKDLVDNALFVDNPQPNSTPSQLKYTLTTIGAIIILILIFLKIKRKGVFR